MELGKRFPNLYKNLALSCFSQLNTDVIKTCIRLHCLLYRQAFQLSIKRVSFLVNTLLFLFLPVSLVFELFFLLFFFLL